MLIATQMARGPSIYMDMLIACCQNMECLRSHATPVHTVHLKTLTSLLMRKGCSTDFMQLNTRAWDGFALQTINTHVHYFWTFSGWSYIWIMHSELYKQCVWRGTAGNVAGQNMRRWEHSLLHEQILTKIKRETKDGEDSENVWKRKEWI